MMICFLFRFFERRRKRKRGGKTKSGSREFFSPPFSLPAVIVVTLQFPPLLFIFAPLKQKVAALAPYGSFLAMAPPSSLNEGGAGAAGTGATAAAAAAREHQHNAGAEATPVTTSAAAAAVAGDAFGQPAAIPAGDGKRVSAADIQVRSFLCAFGGEWAPESYAAERTEDA
jgi:hypothetical protein